MDSIENKKKEINLASSRDTNSKIIFQESEENFFFEKKRPRLKIRKKKLIPRMHSSRDTNCKTIFQESEENFSDSIEKKLTRRKIRIPKHNFPRIRGKFPAFLEKKRPRIRLKIRKKKKIVP